MLLQLHETLQRLLYEQGQMSIREVDITFDAPTLDRITKLIRPTVNIFLFDLQENTELRQSNFQNTRQNGRSDRRLPPRRFDLRYMVSALTNAIEDEHLLLWRTLLTLLQHPQLPTDLFPTELHQQDIELRTHVSQTDESQRLASLWNALGVPPHPALYYVVTVPVDMNLVIEAPLVLTRTLRYKNALIPETVEEHRVQSTAESDARTE